MPNISIRIGNMFAGTKLGTADDAPFIVGCTTMMAVLLRVTLVGIAQFSLNKLGLAVPVVQSAVRGRDVGTVGLLAAVVAVAARGTSLRQFYQGM